MRSSATRCITVSTSNTAWGTIVAPVRMQARMPGLQPERVEERVDDQVAVAFPQPDDVGPRGVRADARRVREHRPLGLARWCPR